MTDHDDELITGAFADFRNEVAPLVRPAGAGHAQQMVRVRRRRRAGAVAALVASAIAIPAGAYAAVGRESDGPPAQTAGTPTAGREKLVSDLSVTATKVSFRKDASGGYRGTAVISIRNDGPSATGTQFTMVVASTFSSKVADQPPCQGIDSAGACGAVVAPGSVATFKVEFTTASKPDHPTITVTVAPAGGHLDPDPTNNTVKVIADQ